MRSSSRNLALAAIVTVLSASLHAAETAAQAAAPAAQASAPAAKPAAHAAQAAPSQPAAQAAAPAAQAAQAQPAAEGVKVDNAPAAAGKNACEDVKAAIDAKIKAKGVKTFTLEIVGKDEVKDAKVVGNCEGGKKLITYKRG